MAMMGSLVENDFMKHATQLKEFHYRIGVLRHPMDTVVCVGKYLKEGGSEVRMCRAVDSAASSRAVLTRLVQAAVCLPLCC
jgi:hypothetical protein